MKSRLETYLDHRKSNELFEHCTVVGLGALGSKASLYLSKAGLDLTVIDRDFVEERNLATQLYRKGDVNRLKSKAMKEIIESFTGKEVRSKSVDLMASNIESEISETDLIVDATDSLRTKLLLNDYAKKESIPMISGMIGGAIGMVLTINEDSPCLKCVLGEKPVSEESCDTLGISPGITEVVSGLQVKHAVNQLLGEPYENLHSLDLDEDILTEVKTKRRKNCSTCRGEYRELNRIKQSRVLCGGDSVQIYPRVTDPGELKEINSKVEVYEGAAASLEKKDIEITVFKEGRAIVKGVSNVREAEEKYDRYLGGR